MTAPVKTDRQRVREIAPERLIEIAKFYDPNRSVRDKRERAKEAINYAAHLILAAENFHREMNSDIDKFV